LAKGHERGAFWANSDGSYRDAKWSAYTIPTKKEIRDYLAFLGNKTMVLFPNAVDKVHRDPSSLVTRLETCGLAGSADAVLHFPEVTFSATFWPAVVRAIQSPGWHCYVHDRDVAFSRFADPRQLITALAMAFFREEESWRDGTVYRFVVNRESFPFSAPVLLSGKTGKRHDEKPFGPWDCARTIEDGWLPKLTRFQDTLLGSFRRLADGLKVVLRSEIKWVSERYVRSYDYSSTSWDLDKRADAQPWPEDLVSAIEQDSPLTFDIQGPYLAKLIEASPGLAESTWLRDFPVERLW
jgi:hypothetical protein